MCPTINQFFLKLRLPLSQLRVYFSGSLSCIFNFCEALKTLCQSFKVTFFSSYYIKKCSYFWGCVFTHQVLFLGLFRNDTLPKMLPTSCLRILTEKLWVLHQFVLKADSLMRLCLRDCDQQRSPNLIPAVFVFINPSITDIFM